MDESGTSRDEPILLVAAVLIHADSQLEPVEELLKDIIDKYVAEPMRDGFVFHAADLFSGNKKKLPQEILDKKIRLAMLEAIVSIPSLLKLPVCFGYIDKRKFRRFNRLDGVSEHKVLIAMHAAAIAECTVLCERWMRGNAKAEVAILFAEDNGVVRSAAKETQILMRSKDAIERLGLRLQGKDVLPLLKIKDGINFVTKPESRALQLADACAWAARKWLRRDTMASRYASLLKPQIRYSSMTSSDAAARLRGD